MLQCVAVRCSVLQCVAVCGSVFAVCGSVLQCVVVCLQYNSPCVTTHCNTCAQNKNYITVAASGDGGFSDFASR